jgi:O-antigen ligase
VGWGNSAFYVLREFPDYGWQHPYAATWTAPDGDSAATTASNNMVVRVLAETGAIGGLIFVLWHIGVARRGIRSLKAGEPLVIGLLVASAGIVAHYSALSGLDKRYWFFLPAMIVAISALELGKEKIARAQAVAVIGTAEPRRAAPETSRQFRR